MVDAVGAVTGIASVILVQVRALAEYPELAEESRLLAQAAIDIVHGLPASQTLASSLRGLEKKLQDLRDRLGYLADGETKKKPKRSFNPFMALFASPSKYYGSMSENVAYIRRLNTEIRSQIELISQAAQLEDKKNAPAMAIENPDGRQWWGRYFPRDNMVRYVLFEGAVEQTFHKEPSVLGRKPQGTAMTMQVAGGGHMNLSGGTIPAQNVNTRLSLEWQHSSFGREFLEGEPMLPRLRRVMVADPENNTSVFKLDALFRATGFENLKALVAHFAQPEDDNVSVASSSEMKPSAGDRVFFIHVRDKEAPFDRIAEYKSNSGFVMCGEATTLVQLRRRIRECHGAEFDVDDKDSVVSANFDDDEEEEEEFIEFLREGAFAFGLKTVVDGKSEFLTVPRKQEKTFLLKEKSSDDICVFQAPKMKKSSSTASLPGQVQEELGAADAERLLKVAGDCIVTDPKKVEKIELGNKVDLMEKRAERDWARSLTVDKVVADANLARELRGLLLQQNAAEACEEADVQFLQALKRLESQLVEKYLTPLFEELGQEKAKLRKEYLKAAGGAAPEARGSEDDAKNIMDAARLENVKHNVYERFILPELAEFQAEKRQAEKRLQKALDILKMTHRVSPLRSLNLLASKSKQKHEDESSHARLVRLRRAPIQIVIVGGGLGGAVLFRLWSNLTDERVAVTLIDLKDYAENTMAVLRMVCEPEKQMGNTLCRHSDYMGQQGQVVVGRATKIEADHVVINDGERVVPFDYCVIATGSVYKSYIKTDNASLDYRKKQMLYLHGEVAKCEQLLVIGGGVVGSELCGELITAFPNKRVVLVHSGSKLVSRAHPATGDHAKNTLEKLGAKIIFNERVTHFDPVKKCYVCQSGLSVPFDPSKDREFWCTGYSLELNKSILGESLKKVDPGIYNPADHSINCLSTNQLSAKFPHMWVMGDCTGRERHLNGERMAFGAWIHAQMIHMNMKLILAKHLKKIEEAAKGSETLDPVKVRAPGSEIYPKHMWEFKPFAESGKDSIDGKHIQILSLGPTYEVVQISEPNMRAQMMQTDVGKETGVELHSDNVLKNMFDIEHFIPAALLAKVDAVLESSIPFYTTESEELKAVRGY